MVEENVVRTKDVRNRQKEQQSSVKGMVEENDVRMKDVRNQHKE